MQKKQENRGGRRPNQTGRPIDPNSKRQQKLRAGSEVAPTKNKNKTLSQEAVDRMTEVTARFAESTGLSVEEILCSIAWGEAFAKDAALTTRLKAVERIFERLAPKIQEGGIADTHGGPPAELPARRPHPETVH